MVATKFPTIYPVSIGLSVPGLFSPLFIGAMVATMERTRRDRDQQVFQSPFHRGNGCYSLQITGIHFVTLSVPFSSGQWLLRNANA